MFKKGEQIKYYHFSLGSKVSCKINCQFQKTGGVLSSILVEDNLYHLLFIDYEYNIIQQMLYCLKETHMLYFDICLFFKVWLHTCKYKLLKWPEHLLRPCWMDTYSNNKLCDINVKLHIHALTFECYYRNCKCYPYLFQLKPRIIKTSVYIDGMCVLSWMRPSIYG